MSVGIGIRKRIGIRKSLNLSFVICSFLKLFILASSSSIVIKLKLTHRVVLSSV